MPAFGRETAEGLLKSLREYLELVRECAATLAGRSNKTITLVDNTSNANNDIYKDFCFSWNYDGWGGLTESHTPGCGLYEYAYDARGREVLMSNSLMSPSGTTTYRLRYTVYDGFDRVSAVRYVNSTSKLSVLRTLTRGSTASTLPTTVTSKFTTLCTALTREYFPFSSFTYPNSGALVFVADAGVVAATDVNKTKVKGMLKCETVYPAPNADGTAPSSSSPTLARGFHYDSKGRTIQLIESYSDNHAVRYSTKYNFAGEVMARRETHSGAVSTYITTTYTRDSRGRTLSVARNVDGTAMASATYGYDALGNMTSDGRKGLVFSYNVCNLPREVTSGASGSLTYTYLSDGTKVSAIKSDGFWHSPPLKWWNGTTIFLSALG